MDKLWRPSQLHISAANMTAFIDYIACRHNTVLPDYEALQRWALDNLALFWSSFWQFSEIVGDLSGPAVINEKNIEKAKFFPESQINFTENLLQASGPREAVIFWGENKVKRTLSWDELKSNVASFAQALKDQDVRPGDRVAAFVPNTPEALIAALATAAIGAIWSSCSPDFGVQGVLDRFQQIEPKILIAAQGYFYNGKEFSCLDKLEKIRASLPTISKTIIYEYTNPVPDKLSIENAVNWDGFIAPYINAELIYDRFPFNHPLFIMFSSGTTGKPKCIVHGAGGTLIQHKKEHLLHCNIKLGDRLFYFTTCGWMMWNWLITGLASQATLMLYDGSPFYPDGNILFDYADAHRMTVFGTAAKYIDTLKKEKLQPQKTHNLSSIKVITSTGSPLLPDSYDYVYNHIKQDIQLSSISGGTDIISCFCIGNPIKPVYRGQLQTAGLGLNVQVFDDNGKQIIGTKGELVCTNPFPSQPVSFWNDLSGEKYREAYYARFPGVWHHGDFIEQTPENGFIIHGRSDTVLNPGGVRIGTAEIYRQVEKNPAIIESVAISQDWSGDVRIILFVKLREGLTLDASLIKQLKDQIRTEASPRHVPAIIIAVPDIPRTRSGKIVELAIRDIIHGRDVKNTEALLNPEALNLYKNLPALQQEYSL